ncbi:p32K [Bearded dragon adenovirus 1]|uniref:p32K n=1 Tax=Bearded dragon adenovirus 1 TaxID=2729647 RepID=A0A6M4MJF8_9ADEN|nr:p32K [Bearded dragon adenovirus 1]QJR83083.1 p32K [Bearded dragon adenovirus 1]QPN96201.1 p32K [Bearded dragon adenovirus 1]
MEGGAARRARSRVRRRRTTRRKPAYRRRTDALRRSVRDLLKKISKEPAVRASTPVPAPAKASTALSLPRTAPPPYVYFDRNDVWRGAQFPTAAPYWGQQTGPAPAPQNYYCFSNAKATAAAAEDVAAVTDNSPRTRITNAPERRPVRVAMPRPADGEADSDVVAPRPWSIDEVFRILGEVNSATRRVVLNSLFGVGVGLILDTLLGSPLGLSTRILRGILAMIPGGGLILSALDALGYLFNKSGSNNLLQLTYDPSFRTLADNVQTQLPATTAEDLLNVAEQQLGSGFWRSIGSALGAAASYFGQFNPATLLPVAIVAPRRR